MRVLTTRIHGVIDYLVAALLIAAPWLLGFTRDGPETWVPVVLGIAIAGYSLATDYELGLTRRLQMPIHLWMDAIAGLMLAVSPWLFAFDDHVWIPHLAVGMAAMAIAGLTDTIPGYERRSDPGAPRS